MLVCCHLCCVVYILLTVTVTVTFPVFIYILIDCYQTIALRINKYSDSDSEFDFNLAE